MKIICTLLLVVSTYALSAQTTLFINGKSYPATETFELSRNATFSEKLSVCIAKNGKEGFLSLSTKSMLRALIRGKVTLYLDDTSTITCIDRGINDYVDDRATSIYYLNEKEIKKLMFTNISTIRYNLKSEWDKKSYTADNKEEKAGDWVLKEKINFPLHIRNLFNNY